MGNHEFCSRCHASDFHRNQTCEEAYPEKLKRADAERAALERQHNAGIKKLTVLQKKLARLGVKATFTYFNIKISALEIHWQGFVGVQKAKEALKPREPIDDGW